MSYAHKETVYSNSPRRPLCCSLVATLRRLVWLPAPITTCLTATLRLPDREGCAEHRLEVRHTDSRRRSCLEGHHLQRAGELPRSGVRCVGFYLFRVLQGRLQQKGRKRERKDSFYDSVLQSVGLLVLFIAFNGFVLMVYTLPGGSGMLLLIFMPLMYGHRAVSTIVEGRRA